MPTHKLSSSVRPVRLIVAGLALLAAYQQQQRPPRIVRRDYHIDVREFMSRTKKGEK